MIPSARVGVCTWIFGGAPLTRLAAELARMGFGGVELRADYETDSPEDINSIFGDWGLSIFSLTPMDVDLSHPDAQIRRAAIADYERLLDFAAALEDEPFVCIHGLVGRCRAIEDDAAEYAHLVESVAAVAELAGARRLRLVFEVLNRYETHQVRTPRSGCAIAGRCGRAQFGHIARWISHEYRRERPSPRQSWRRAPRCGSTMRRIQTGAGLGLGIAIGGRNWRRSLKSATPDLSCWNARPRGQIPLRPAKVMAGASNWWAICANRCGG